jgi:PAS domain S-box-containing protein
VSETEPITRVDFAGRKRRDGTGLPPVAEPAQPPGLRLAAAAVRNQIRSFGVIVGTFILLLVIALAASWIAIEIVNTTRAYATGEGRYSKAEKIAVLDLHRYAYSADPADYQAFLAAIAVPRGDFMARDAMEHAPVALQVARRGLLAGENHPDDVEGLIEMFLWFGWWEPFAAAVEDWREGDRLVTLLLAQGGVLAQRIQTGTLDDEARMQLLDAIDRIDEQLTARENTFSTHMGEAARGATSLVIIALGATTVLLWVIGIAFASRLFRQQLALGRQLGSSEQRFRDYAEVASDWYWEMDADFRFTYLSERFRAVTGAAPQELLQRSATEFIRHHAESGEGTRHLLALSGHHPFRGLVLRFGEGAAASFCSLAGRPHLDEDGLFQGYRGIGTDMTASVRDAQMLREAKERAEAANSTKSEFLANMSHELRTPLNAILGFSEIIARRHFGADAFDRYAEYAEDIHQSARHLLAIIDDILDVSKIEAGHFSLYEGSTSLDQLVKSAQLLLGDRIEQAGLSLRLDVPDPPPLIRGDERKLAQVLVNLLSNSIKFTPRGGAVAIEGRFEPDGSLSVTVQDDGIGIPADQFQTVLAPFGQVESAFNRKHQGTGLGLPLAKALMELHGGTLSLASAVGAGTTVTLTLPPDRVLQPASVQRVTA